MRKRTLLAGLMALVLVLAAAMPSQAQVSFSYGRGYGGRGYSIGTPWVSYGRYSGGYYGRGWGYPYYGYGYYPYRSGVSISVGRPYYGYSDYDYYPRTTGYFMTEAPVYRSERASYRAAYGPDERRATVRVTVPTADAKVWFEDTLTRQDGRSRTFVTPALEAGGAYTYVVKATWTQDGREMTQEKEVRVRPGTEATVAFESRRARDEAIQVEPRELRDLDRPAPRDAKPKPKADAPPPPE